MARVSLRQRRQRRENRQRKGMSLNIISLIDIFTVLVFFLLLNSTELELLPESKAIRLPESLAESRAHETLVVMVNNDDILLQGAVVAHVGEVMASTDRTIPALKTALIQALVTTPALAAPNPVSSPAPGAAASEGRELTIMGDREIPYRLLKKVLATCTDSDFGQLSLAVLQKSEPVRREPAL